MIKTYFVEHYWKSAPSRHALVYASTLLAYANNSIDVLLDIGAGDGIVSTVIGESAGIRYHGLDVGAPIYPVTSNVTYVKSPASILDLMRGESAEAVVAFDILEHCEDLEAFASQLFVASTKYVMVSLPNEMSIHVRSSFFLGRGIPCHGLHMLGCEEGHRHRWLIGYSESRALLSRLAENAGFSIVGEVFITVLPRTPWKRLILKPFLASLPHPLRAHGFAFLFERNMRSSCDADVI